MSKEIWKSVKSFENKYAISNKGRLKNIQNGHIYKNTNQFGDYFSVVLYDNEKKKSVRIHRLVAEAFILNPNNFKYVNHKDRNKQNNCVENLEWCTQSYNTIHAIQNGANTLCGMLKYNKNKCHNKYGNIYQYDKSKNLLNIFYDIKQASEYTGVCSRDILHCINNEPKRKSAGGYIWESEVVSNALRDIENGK